MAVQFILGRSGSGKTNHCIQSIIRDLVRGENGPPLVLLVPEQATYQAQRAILAGKEIAGYSRLRVLSFQRLCFWLIGKHTAGSEISRLGREMIIHKILRDNRDELTLFGPTAQTPGLAAKLADVITEMHECAHSPSDASQLAVDLAKAEPRKRPNEKTEPCNITAMKFKDIAFIFEQYTRSIAGKFVDPDIQLSEALRKIPHADFLSGARLWVDGFADFTVQQRKLLVGMLKAASESHIALCLDPTTIDSEYPDLAELDDTSLFGPTERTFAELTEAVRKSKLPLAKPVILVQPLRFEKSPALAHIESGIFKPDTAHIKTDNAVKIVSSANRRAEIGYIAEQITKLVRHHNYRFGDIAVIASDISSYQHYIEALFNDYNIPFFIDKPKSLWTHPVIELITSALQAVTNGFSCGDVLACLKTGLANVRQSDVDILENYCLAFGIGAGDWLAASDWDFAPQDDSAFDPKMIDEIRRLAIAPLCRLRDELGTVKDVRPISAGQLTKAVWNFLESLDFRAKLLQWSRPEEQPAGSRPWALSQFYDKLTGLFDELDEVFGTELMPVQDWMVILSNAFSKLALKLIPPTLDQVLAGSIERSRHPDLKAVFCAGATQKQFPQPVPFDGILTDDDRTVADGHNFRLRPKALQQLTNRQYLAYIAFTRPSQYLCITYPMTTDSGAPGLPSQFLDNLKSLFVDLADEPADLDDSVAEAPSHARLADMLCVKLGKDSTLPQDQADRLYALLEGLGEDKNLSQLSRRVKHALGYENKGLLDKNFAKNFYGDSLECSASRLAGFADCPYKHFARYVLKLQRRKQFTLEPLDLGRFYHCVLDGLFARLQKDGKDFATASELLLRSACSEVVTTTVETDAFLSNFKNRTLHNAYILDSAAGILYEAVADYAKMAQAGLFRQIASEFAFGMNHQDPARYRLATPDRLNISLKGKIDRIDLADINGRSVALIFDYKKKPQSFSWSRFYHALDIQLAVYMLALAGARIKDRRIDSVAGAFYIPVEAAPAKGTVADSKAGAGKFTRKAKGIFNGQFADALHSELAPGRWDQFYNFFTTKGEPYGHFATSGALRPAEFESLLKFARQKIIQTAKQIVSGCIDITPYRLGGKSPCEYCDYRAVCKFDWQINHYNPLAPAGKEEVLKQAKGIAMQ
jgi:ATP-dependent helicase/nuclease subunit B